nr:hypothetical protein [Chromobacterium sphagni]
MPHLQQHLGQPGDPRRAFAVADIGFHRAQRAELGVRRLRLEGLAQPRHLYRVAQLGAGAVRLDIADRPRVYAGLGDRVGYQLAMRARIGTV